MRTTYVMLLCCDALEKLLPNVLTSIANVFYEQLYKVQSVRVALMILLSTPCFFSLLEHRRSSSSQYRVGLQASAQRQLLFSLVSLLLERFSNNGPSQFSLQWPFLGSELALLCRSLCYVAALMQRWDSVARRLRACVVLLFCFMAKQLSSSKYPCGFEQLFPVINCD